MTSKSSKSSLTGGGGIGGAAAAHTYVAGEDESRLADAAKDLGLDRDEGRMPSTSWANLLFNDDTLTAARMHSIGYVGQDERVDEYGTLHQMSVRKRRRRQHGGGGGGGGGADRPRQYEQLTDLFATPGTAATTTTTTTTSLGADDDDGGGRGGGGGGEDEDQDDDEDDDDDEEEMIDMVEGGSLGAAVFGIVKGTVGPAILYLPRGFYQSGYAVSIPSMIFATSMFIYNAYRLLECWKVENERNHRVESRLREVRAFLLRNAEEKRKQMQTQMQMQAMMMLSKNNKHNNNKNNNKKNEEIMTMMEGGDGKSYGTAMLPTEAASHSEKAADEDDHDHDHDHEAKQDHHVFTAKLLTYPELAKRALGSYSILVELGIALFQFGVCLTYLIFVPDNLYECMKTILVGSSSAASSPLLLSKTTLLWIMIAVEIPLSWIRDIRKLTTTNVIASFLIAFGLCSVLAIAVAEGTQKVPVLPNDDEDDDAVDAVDFDVRNVTVDGRGHHDDIDDDDDGPWEWAFVRNLRSLRPLTETWYLFIGTSFFMMEGSITLLVPLQEAVYRAADRARFPDMNRDVTSFICAFYVAFSLAACAAFGSDIRTALTASLEGTLAAAVQLAYSVAVVLTFPLQAFPAMEVAVRMLVSATTTTMSSYSSSSSSAAMAKKGYGGNAESTPNRNVYATVIVLVLGIVATISIDYLGNVVSILGSLFGIPLALVFPPLMHNILVLQRGTDAAITTAAAATSSSSSTTGASWRTRTRTRSVSLERAMNYSVVVVGIFAMASASFNTIVTWDQGAESSS